jgi:prephenate dehydratase
MSPESQIAYLGIEGSNSHKAAGDLFPGCGLQGYRTWIDILSATERTEVARAVVPVENALTGRIDGIYQALSNTNLYIAAEYILPIDHCLLVHRNYIDASNKSNFILNNIYEVISHPQGFMQCQSFISSRLRHAKLIDATDTANAALRVAELASSRVASISPRECADRYKLIILEGDIADEPGNATRFLVLSQEPLEATVTEGPGVTTILFRTKHEPGALAGALAAFANQGINLTKLETYMASRERRRPTFYVDVGETMRASRMSHAMSDFAAHVEYWRVLGSYPASARRGIVSGFLAI